MKIVLEAEDQVLVRMSKEEWHSFCRISTRYCRDEGSDRWCNLVADLQDAIRSTSSAIDLKEMDKSSYVPRRQHKRKPRAKKV